MSETEARSPFEFDNENEYDIAPLAEEILRLIDELPITHADRLMRKSALEELVRQYRQRIPQGLDERDEEEIRQEMINIGKPEYSLVHHAQEKEQPQGKY